MTTGQTRLDSAGPHADLPRVREPARAGHARREAAVAVAPRATSSSRVSARIGKRSRRSAERDVCSYGDFFFFFDGTDNPALYPTIDCVMCAAKTTVAKPLVRKEVSCYELLFFFLKAELLC